MGRKISRSRVLRRLTEEVELEVQYPPRYLWYLGVLLSLVQVMNSYNNLL
ncbi:hypothetical protein [Ligilactobacillus salivarius]|nr:hypothetical protein [Ligilactobacillus salivarius]